MDWRFSSLSLHMLAVSILAVSSISVGMGTTISATGAIVILVKRGAIKAVAGARKERDSKVRKIIEITGAAFSFCSGSSSSSPSSEEGDWFLGRFHLGGNTA